ESFLIMNYLAKYQTFANKQELNEAMADHLNRCKYELNETDREVLIMLSRYAVKYVGVAHLKVATIAKAVGKSNITIRRILNKLVDFHILEKRTFIRETSGGNGANLYILLPPFLSSNDSPELITRGNAMNSTGTRDEGKEIRNEPISFLNNKNIITNTYSSDIELLDVSPYEEFKALITTFLGEGQQP